MRRFAGNALLLILVAVFLFAVLAYAITRSSANQGSIRKETSQLLAAELMSYFAAITEATAKLKLVERLSDDQINFRFPANVSVWGGYDNTACIENRCRLFHPDGGRVSAISDYARFRKPGANTAAPYLYYAPIQGVGTARSDIVYSIHGIDWDICSAINRANGISGVPLNIPEPVAGDTMPYAFPAVPFSPIPDTAPITPPIASNGLAPTTYCSCAHSLESVCRSHAFMPRVMHIVVAR